MSFLYYVGFYKFNLSRCYYSLLNDKKHATRTLISISSRKISSRDLMFYLVSSIVFSFFVLMPFGSIHGFSFCIVIYIGIFLFCTLFALVKRYIFYRTKESKPLNINLYQRELPANLRPAHVRVLVFDGAIDSITVAATILDLVDRGYLCLNTINRADLFKKELVIKKTNKDQDGLFSYEKYLLNWLFKDEVVTSTSLKNMLNDVRENPGCKFTIFEGLVLLSFPLNRYYRKVDNEKSIVFYSCCVIISYLSYPIVDILFYELVFPNLFIYVIWIFIYSFGVSNLFFASPTYLFNDEGAEVRDQFLDLKRFLNDFSIIQEKSSEMIVLWNFYLSYSIALGLSGVACDEIMDFFGEKIYKQNSSEKFSKEEEFYINNMDEEISCAQNLYHMLLDK